MSKDKPESKTYEVLIGYNCITCGEVHISSAMWESDTDENPLCRAAMDKATREELRENLWEIILRGFMDTHGNIPFEAESVIEDQARLLLIREQQDIAARVPMPEKKR